MKLLPDQPKKYKVKICTCGKAEQIISMNKNAYQNTALFIIAGSCAFAVGLICTPFAIAQGSTMSLFNWVALIGGLAIWTYLFRRTIVFKHEGHSLYCAARRVIIEIAR